MNYLILRALSRFYNCKPGPYQRQACFLYKKLRENVVETVFEYFNQTGFIWEHFWPDDGSPHGAHPFTGWSSLVVLIMTEIYD